MDIAVTDWQEEILFCESRFQFVAGGRRVGKSELAKARIKVRCLNKPGHSTMYLSPVCSQGEELFEALAFDDDLLPFIARTKTRPGRIWFKNGARVDFRSLERSKNIRGRGLHEVIVDESQDVKESDYNHVIRPLVSDKQGSVLMLGQFRGKDWRYRMFFEPGQAAPGAKENPRDFGIPRHKSWVIPSWLGPCFQTPEGKLELDIARAQLPAFAFAQEYGCELASNPDAAFKGECIERIVKGEAKNLPETGATYIAGMDLGRVRDPSTFVVMDARTGAIPYFERFPLGMEHALQARRAGELSRHWNNATVVLDSTGGATGGHAKPDEYVSLYRQSIRDVRPVFLQQKNKTEIISNLALMIEQQKLSIPSAHATLLDELRTYQAVYRNGYWNFFGPSGHDDDLVIGLALAAWGRKSGWAPTGRGVDLRSLIY